MKFVGLDFCGLNSLACARDDEGPELFQGSAYPQRLSCVLFPLVRKEKVLAGDEALRSDRGSGLPWPPLAMAPQDGWGRTDPPTPGGRLLLATVWQQLNKGDRWSDPQWQPPDGLPLINRPTPAECLTAEVWTVLKQTKCDATTSHVVLGIPNQLPEESQESLLGRLPSGSCLVWRSVAAAMAWAEENSEGISSDTQLAVIDAGLYRFEISDFDFRRQEVRGHVYHVPIRRVSRLHAVHTYSLLSDSPAPFTAARPDPLRIENHLSEISRGISPEAALLICGTLGSVMVNVYNRRFPDNPWPPPIPHAVARGSCLFAFRLANGLPTYRDVLPSLELFTLTEEHEPNWLRLIEPDIEVDGGENYERVHLHRAFIEQGAGRVSSWLQRSGEKEFRKLTTDLPLQAARKAWVDLKVSARSAAGFARLRMIPSNGEFEVFGPGQALLLNWQSMERVARGPAEKWPPGLVKFGWPEKCGRLYAHRRFFEEFLEAAADVESIFSLRDVGQRLARLDLLKERVRQTIAPHLAGVTGAGGDAAPVNLLVCFSTVAPCEFMDGGYAGRSETLTPLPGKDDQARNVARLLWQRLKVLSGDPHAVSSEINAVVYILGRMGGYAPDAFQNQLAGEIRPVTNAVRLFAAGRVLQTSDHGLCLFETVNEKADFGQVLNLNWLRMLVYVLYQRPDVLKDVPREHVVASASLCLDVFEQQVQQGNVHILFMNSLRALALLLRVRRHAQTRDFLCPDKCPQDEARLANRLSWVLLQANSMRLRPGPKTLVERVTEWLNRVASTDEMPPIAPPDEEDAAEGPNDG